MLSVLLATISNVAFSQNPPISFPNQTAIEFQGAPTGGSVHVYDVSNIDQPYRFNTSLGMTTLTLLQEIERELNSSTDSFTNFRLASLQEDRLVLHTSGFFLDGNDSGLGITSPPRALTVVSDDSGLSYTLMWLNPVRYDRLRFLLDTEMAGGVTNFHIAKATTASQLVTLVGFINNVPGAAAVAEVEDGKLLERSGAMGDTATIPNWLAINRGLNVKVVEVETPNGTRRCMGHEISRDGFLVRPLLVPPNARASIEFDISNYDLAEGRDEFEIFTVYVPREVVAGPIDKFRNEVIAATRQEVAFDKPPRDSQRVKARLLPPDDAALATVLVIRAHLPAGKSVTISNFSSDIRND